MNPKVHAAVAVSLQLQPRSVRTGFPGLKTSRQVLLLCTASQRTLNASGFIQRRMLMFHSGDGT